MTSETTTSQAIGAERFPDRISRMDAIISGAQNNVTARFPLMAEIKIKDSLFEGLKRSLQVYLQENLTEAYPDKNFPFTPEMLNENASAVSGLPNLTPNGLLLPKIENFLSFNLVQKALARIVKDIGVGDQVDRIQMPPSIRVVNGAPNAKIDSRPRASVKLHSDIWAGETPDSMMVFIPCFGDMNLIGIENREPTLEFGKSFLRPLNDYLEGAHLEEGSILYPLTMKLGYAYVIDPFVLHRTLKKASGLRLSIDLRFRPKQKAASDGIFEDYRSESYIPLKDWLEAGVETILTSNLSMSEHTSFESTLKVKNEYASRFNSIKTRI